MRSASQNGQHRGAFTLVEMLVTISIVLLLASTALFAFSKATLLAKEDRARAQVAMLDGLIMEHWDAFRTRPLRLQLRGDAQAAATTRLNVIRELMRVELPDRVSDLVDPMAGGRTRSSVAQRYANLGGSSGNTSYQGAECLYLIVSSMRDPIADPLTFFSENEIGDLDSDGLLEFQDPWGNPIEFLRWAPDFIQYSDLQDGNPVTSPDSLDPLRVDARWQNGDASDDPYLLFPLIYSAGPDEEYGLVSDSEDGFRYSITTPPNDPYAIVITSDGRRMGAAKDASNEFADNITNHILDTN